MSMKRMAVVALAGLFACNSAFGHKINPMEHKYRQGPSTPLGEVSEPVHEELTQLARACQQSRPGALVLPLVCGDRSNLSRDPRGNKYDALVRGVWWNDDPNQMLFALRQAKWLLWLDDAHGIATRGVNWRGRPARIGPDYNMTYRSHYGDMQFLHAMASADEEAASETREHVLLWAEFAYHVAVGRLDAETFMDRIEPSGLRAYFPLQSGWTVNYLFAPHYRLREGTYTRRMAAGSLLHMVQDSYSAAHVDREFGPTARCPTGRVLEFHSYTHQDPDRHGAADIRSAWQARSFTDAQDPVNASATLLAYIAQGAEWDVVKSYLTGTVFCIDSDARIAGPGEFATIGATP